MIKPWRTAPDHESLFLQRYDRLVVEARRVLRLTSDQAVELVHDAFLQFVFARPRLDAIEQIDAYLFGIIRKIHLSGLRRAARQRVLSIAYYDSAAVALRDWHRHDEAQALQKLARVCAYCAVRKESSKAASFLALRYFLGYTPPGLARLACATRGAVASWLHLGRAEARLFLETPERVAFLGQAIVRVPHIGLDLGEDERLAALVTWLRRHRVGACLTAQQIFAMYAPDGADSPDCATLAHLVSCAPCLLAAEDASTAGDD